MTKRKIKWYREQLEKLYGQVSGDQEHERFMKALGGFVRKHEFPVVEYANNAKEE